MYPFFFRFLFLIAYYRVLSRVSCTTQKVRMLIFPLLHVITPCTVTFGNCKPLAKERMRVCDIVIYDKKSYLVFVWHGAPETLGIP